MRYRAESIFYTLASFVIFMAAFILAPTGHTETKLLQNEVKEQFRVAFIQTIGDQPYFEEAKIIFAGVREFYTQSADSAIALFKHEEADRDIALVFKGMYQETTKLIVRYLPKTKILASQPETSGTVSGVNILPYVVNPAGLRVDQATVPPVANFHTPWVTIQDNITGQLFCLAIYNGEVNKYLGECVDGYY